jgi:hypothetical protein
MAHARTIPHSKENPSIKYSRRYVSGSAAVQVIINPTIKYEMFFETYTDA